MSCREEFEAWWENEQPFMAKWGIEKADAYYIWKSSRINMVVELPEEHPGYMYYAPDVVEAILVTGVKVKS